MQAVVTLLEGADRERIEAILGKLRGTLASAGFTRGESRHDPAAGDVQEVCMRCSFDLARA
jgi:hypothetical protein